MFDDLLKFSVKEVAVGVLLAVVLIGVGVAAVVAFVPRSEGGDLAPPVSPIPPPISIQPVQPVAPVQPPTTIPPVPPVNAETGVVTLPPIPPVIAETATVSVPAEPIPPQREPVSLVADDFAVTVGAVSGGFINPWLNVYDTKALELSATAFDEASIRGVDIDRSTLQIKAVATQTLYGSVQLTARGFLSYQPNSNLTVSAEGLTDTIRYSVMTTQDGVMKVADSTITVRLQPEDFERNRTAFDALLAGAPAVRNSFLGNFRYSDSQISNADLAIAQFLIQNDFTDDSVDTILSLPRSISPLSPVIYDRHTLTKLLSIEQSIYQNANLNLSPHGPVHWPSNYSQTMKQASFIIPNEIQVIEGLKHIYYDKLDIDEVFEKLGGEYTGMFSRGQNYTPFYVTIEDATEEQRNFFSNRYPGGEEFGSLGHYFAGGIEYFNNLEKDSFHWNELVVDFSVVSTLDAFNFTLGNKLKDASDVELTFRHDEFIEINYNARTSSFGEYGYTLNWENSKMKNGEVTNVYNLSRNIVGIDGSSEWEGIFDVMDWLIDNVGLHFVGSPYFPGKEEHPFFYEEQVNALNTLPNNVFIPSSYIFIPKNFGGIYFGDSGTIPGHLTSSLRSLGISSESFRSNLVGPRTGPGWVANRDRYRESLSVQNLMKFYNPSAEQFSFNVGFVLVNGTPWFYEGNFPFGAPIRTPPLGSYRALISRENFNEEKLNIENFKAPQDFVNYFIRNEDLKAVYEEVIGD